MNADHLSAEKVPSEFASILSYAERWGIQDDIDRETAIEEATQEELADVASCLDSIDDGILVAWLTGPESRKSPIAKEHVAITCLTMAVQSAKAEIKRRNREEPKTIGDTDRSRRNRESM